MAGYDIDVAAWALEQAATLRSRSVNRLDWDNLAEEIENVGKSQRRALRSQIGRIIEHLLKLQFSPAPGPRRGWEETLDEARREVELVLADSPSLRRDVGGVIEEETIPARLRVWRLLARYGELTPQIASSLAAAVYSETEVLGDWLPPSDRKDTENG